MIDVPGSLSFGDGGAGVCYKEDIGPKGITLSFDPIHQIIRASFKLKGINYEKPFQITLSEPDHPEYEYFQTPNIYFNFETESLDWEGYEVPISLGCLEPDLELVNVYDFNLTIPVHLPPGNWRFIFSQEGSNIEPIGDEFQVEAENTKPIIRVSGERNDKELRPWVSAWPSLPVFLPSPDGSIVISGSGFAPDSPVYTVVYCGPYEIDGMKLFESLTVLSDSSGSFRTRLAGPFIYNDKCLILGISDKNAQLGFENPPDSGRWVYDGVNPHTEFWIAASTAKTQ